MFARTIFPLIRLVGLSFALLAGVGVALIMANVPRIAIAALTIEVSSREWLLFVVILVAATISSTIGFAFSAFAGAVLFHIEPSPLRAVEIMLLASLGIQCSSLIVLWRGIDWRLCIPYLAVASPCSCLEAIS
jgi:hypothetical protein